MSSDVRERLRSAAREHEAAQALNEKTPLRLVMCGSTGAGKTALTARLMSECGAAPNGAAREPGETTAGVARHAFFDGTRRYAVIDVSGDDRYTRNVVSGVLSADCAVIVLDALKGMVAETRRHTLIAALLGVHNVVVAVNKTDAVEDAAARYREIESECRALAERIGLQRITCIPVSALAGGNVAHRAGSMSWYGGPTLIDALDAAEAEDDAMRPQPLRMPILRVDRRGDGVRCCAGTVAAGTVRRGDRVVIAPSGRTTTVERLRAEDGEELDVALPGRSVTVALAEPVDVGPGDLVAAPSAPPGVADQFEATVIWMGDDPMLRGRSYLMRTGGKTVTATIAPLKYQLNIKSLERVAATKLNLNQIGVCDIELSEPIAFDPYRENRHTGSFILIDRITNETVGAGVIHFALRRSQNVRWQALNIDKHARSTRLHQRPTVLWFTGLSGAGKSTIANLVESELHRRGHHTYVLDGDNVRHGLNADLGFTEADRVENIRRVGEVARLMVDAGLIVLVSFISPFRAERAMARSLLEPGEFIEVYVDTPLEVAEARDVKGLYKKARRGELVNFTGIDSPYEPPLDAEISVNTTQASAHEAAEQVLELLEKLGRLGTPAGGRRKRAARPS